MDSKLHKKMSDRQKKGTLRSLSSFEGSTDFFSNDYLGWGRREKRFFAQVGSTGSRLLSGNSAQHEVIESDFATFFNSQAALHFNSGYDANLGVFSAIPQKGDTILYDELIHASARDGIRLSWAKSHSFRHNDVAHLKQRIEKAEGSVYIAVESLYSMDGDLAPLKELVNVSKSYGAYLIVDEAHSGGVFGAQGKGLAVKLGVESDIFLRLITFGKAYGSHGGLVLGSDDLRQFLLNFSRPFIYSTALPAYVLKHNLSVALSMESEKMRMKLFDNIQYYRSQTTEKSTVSNEESPIQILEIGNVERAQQFG